MKTQLTDAGRFLETMSRLNESTFRGHDLVHDEAARSLTLTLARPDGSRGWLGRRRLSSKVVVTVRQLDNYRQFLARGAEAVYILDRVEVGRGQEEIAFYFRPGDRAVMDVSGIDVICEETGDRIPSHPVPEIVNPLVD